VAVLQLHDRNQQLTFSIQRMSNIKEYRTPQVIPCALLCTALHPVAANPALNSRCVPRLLQGIRSLSRFYLILFVPIFFGPYWAWVADQTNFGFSFFFSILVSDLGYQSRVEAPLLLQWLTAASCLLQLQLAVTGIVNVTISLEGELLFTRTPCVCAVIIASFPEHFLC
jgi:hypothetical protein